jgi:hypothetical protein
LHFNVTEHSTCSWIVQQGFVTGGAAKSVLAREGGNSVRWLIYRQDERDD